MRPLVASHIESLKPYVPGKPISELKRELGLEDIIKLASNVAMGRSMGGAFLFVFLFSDWIFRTAHQIAFGYLELVLG